MYNKEDLLLFVKQSKRHSHIYNNRDKVFNISDYQCIDDMIHITIEYHYVPRSNLLQKVISYLYNKIICYVISYPRREKLDELYIINPTMYYPLLELKSWLRQNNLNKII